MTLYVADCPKGSIVEILDRRYGEEYGSGRLYRLGDSHKLSHSGYLLRNVWHHGTGEPMAISVGLRCRIVENV